MLSEEKEKPRLLLCQLGTAIQSHVIGQRNNKSAEQLSEVSSVTESDTIYSIDKISEDALLEWFCDHWPDHLPVEVIAEGF